jgi:hypothetical protein
METRSRTRQKLRGAAVLAALGALVVPATAGAAVKAPVIRKVTPKTANVGDKLVIYGKYFRLGRGKNRVLFKRTGGRSVFIKAGVSTKRRMTLVIPKRLEKFMAKPGGHPAATRFRLRVLTTKLSARYTTAKNSPVIGPKKPKVVGPPLTPTTPDGDCDGDGLINSVDTDDDNDLLSDVQESSLKLDPCSGDTDGDGVEDGYEYQSALDLNNDDIRTASKIIPYPGKRPYPNPLFKDSNIDYDGDGLTLGDEYELWKYTYTVNHTAARALSPLSYSDGTRYSLSTLDVSTGRRSNFMTTAAYTPPQTFAAWAGLNGYATVDLFAADDPSRVQATFDLYDMDHSTGAPTAVPTGNQRWSEKYYWDDDRDGKVTDDERDEDGDGLDNFDEQHGRLTPEYWEGCYTDEKPYFIAYAGTSAADADSDGDGILDGADDQDHDDVPNVMELSRNMAGNRVKQWGSTQCKPPAGVAPVADANPAQGFVNPFNPCLPDVYSRSCEQHPILGGDAFPPYDDKGEKYLILN